MLLGCFFETDDARRQPDKEKRTGIADASVHPVLQFTPVCRGLAVLIGDEAGRPGFRERGPRFHSAGNVKLLTRRGIKAQREQIVNHGQAFQLGECLHQVDHLVLKRQSAGDDHTDADGAFRMQAFEIFQVAIEKRVLIVPFDFEGDNAFFECADVIHFVRYRFALYAVDRLFDGEVDFLPAFGGQAVTQPLCAFCFPSTPADDFGYGDRQFFQRGRQLGDCLRKVHPDDRGGVAMKFDLIAAVDKGFEHVR